MSISTATFTLTDEQIFTASKNFILNKMSGYYQVLKMTKYSTDKFINYYEGIDSFIVANIRVINKFGKKITIKVNIYPEMVENVYINTPHRVTTHSDGLWLDSKYNEVIDLGLENVDFEDDFETAIIKRDEKIAESKRRDTIKKLQGDLNWNIKQFRSYKAAKRSYAKYDMEDLRDFMIDLTEPQQVYLKGIIEALNEAPEPTTTEQYLSLLTGAKKEIFIQLEKSFEENEETAFNNVLSWMKKEEGYSMYSEVRLNDLAKEYVQGQKMKLFFSAGKHLNNLDITGVEKLTFNSHDNGFEGSWKITLEDNTTRVFSTNTIIASGYIQRMHYRYLSKLS